MILPDTELGNRGKSPLYYLIYLSSDYMKVLRIP